MASQRLIGRAPGFLNSNIWSSSGLELSKSTPHPLPFSSFDEEKGENATSRDVAGAVGYLKPVPLVAPNDRSHAP